ncbi:hypothetical protein M501DRAFT_589644 [Patellaria atrata CBS 101060]|uniref:Chalcone isomerase domain-containing protein n=1 Tax=Patellaria atrata CBS 101060 TaxID=1346257 RepID=A0A9P4VLT8_9PEZI|nr:hypothetical protein M501DRAFT_589644 [Patellaria atrata CBS 101060]
MNPFSTLRLLPRRPLYRCLNAPKSLPRPSIRRFSHQDVDGPPRNPLDSISMHRLQESRRQHYQRRSVYASIGVVVCTVIPIMIVFSYEIPQKAPPAQNEPSSSSIIPKTNLDADPSANQTFQGKPVVVAAGGQKLVAKDTRTGDEIELVETGTSTVPHFPKTIYLPSSDAPTSATLPANAVVNPTEDEYTLLGVGIRRVSFLGIQVYVVGLYVATSSLAPLQRALIRSVQPGASTLIPGEKEVLRHDLVDPEASLRLWDKLLREGDGEHGIRTAWRVAPVRNTDFKHLHEGWVTGIKARAKVPIPAPPTPSSLTPSPSGPTSPLPSNPTQNEFTDDSFGASIKLFQALFRGRGKAPTGSIVLLSRAENGTLEILFKRSEKEEHVERLGTVEDERVSRLIWLKYLAGKDVSSEDCRRSVVEGVLGLVERPVGTMETKVD